MVAYACYSYGMAIQYGHVTNLLKFSTKIAAQNALGKPMLKLGVVSLNKARVDAKFTRIIIPLGTSL